MKIIAVGGPANGEWAIVIGVFGANKERVLKNAVYVDFKVVGAANAGCASSRR